ncbi:MAG: hypothetical protein E7176_04205 [Erysipelotrichaceae bacterium]|nr:hypothetical protein [Erysipelotrichaceae bacterium]
MLRKEKYKYSGLQAIYFNYIFQKSIFVVFLISIILMSIFVVLSSNPWLDRLDYIKYPNDFHLMYFTQASLIIQIFNSIIVATLVISTVIQANSFDTLFLSYIPRKKIALYKILNVSIILFLLCLYELVLFIGVGMLVYPSFVPIAMSYIGFMNIIVVMMFEFSVCIVFTTILPIVFIPMCSLFIFIVIKLLSNNYRMVMDIISKIMPVVKLNSSSMTFETSNPILSIIWVLLLIVIYVNIYSLKDIK